MEPLCVHDSGTVVGRSRRALSEAYEELAPAVRAWVRAGARAGANRSQDLDDVVQEVWLRVLLSYARFDPRRGSLRGWVYRITQRTRLDSLRALRVPLLSLDEEMACVASPGSSAPVSASSLPAGLRTRITQLSPSDRRLLWLCGVEGQPTSSAARCLAISASAARKRWFRLRARLRSPSRGLSRGVQGCGIRRPRSLQAKGLEQSGAASGT